MTTTKNKKRPLTVGILIDWITSDYNKKILSGIKSFFHEREINLLCLESGLFQEESIYDSIEKQLFDFIPYKSLEGLILLANAGIYGNLDVMSRLAELLRPLPMVGVNFSIPSIPCVWVDNHPGVRELAYHLIVDHGYRRFAFLNGPPGFDEVQGRYKVFRETMEELHVPFDPNLVVEGKLLTSGGSEACARLLDKGLPFEVLVCANDEMAIGAQKECEARGIHVPWDLAIVGYDNTDVAISATPPLTTVNQPLERLGMTSAEMLIAEIRGKGAAPQVQLSTRLTVRESCGCSLKDKKPVALFPEFQSHESRALSECLWLRYLPIIDSSPDSIQERIRSSVRNWLESFSLLFHTGESRDFLSQWHQLLYLVLWNQFDVDFCHLLLAPLKEFVMSRKEPPLKLFQPLIDAESLITKKALQRVQYSDLLEQEEQSEIYTIREQLLDTNSLSDMVLVLTEHLPRINIEHFFLCLYKGFEPQQESRILMSMSNKVLNSSDFYLAPEQMLPEQEVMDLEKPFFLIKQVLNFGGEVFGFLLSDCPLSKKYIFNELRRLICRTIENSILNNDIREKTRILENNEKNLKAITDATPLPLAITDMDFRILYANRSFLQNLLEQETLEKGLDLNCFFQDQDFLSRWVMDCQLDDSRTLEIPVRPKKGGVFWAITSYETLVFEERDCYIFSFYDISERRELEKEVLEISSREQRRIAQELHDDICQDLSGLSALSESLAIKLKSIDQGLSNRASSVADLINQTNQKTQSLSRDLFLTEIDAYELSRMLEVFSQRVQELFHVNCRFTSDVSHKSKDSDVLYHLYRIAQESASNALRHGKARNISISFFSSEDKVGLRVKDDGLGFDLTEGTRQGLGLRSMKYRAKLLGGKLLIKSAKNQGVEISCEVSLTSSVKHSC
ncbi:MAG: substrate-binding domain-containing protein [Spirochaetales bacterium]|nr:substrate-binding domain-containing protein [Spirochaetales bacterium]